MHGSIHITRLVLLSALILVSLAASAGSSSDESSDGAAPRQASGPLDGLTFSGALGPEGEPRDTPDTFVFANGTFVSKECELRCKYPARPYFVRINGGKTEFISETRCPYKDARIIWRGIVDGNTIRGKSTWMVRRWYWTVESTFEFEGRLADEGTSKSGGD